MNEKHIISLKLVSTAEAKITSSMPSSSMSINISLKAKKLEKKKKSKIISEFMKSISTINEIIMKTTIHLLVIYILMITFDKQNTAKLITDNIIFANSAIEIYYTSFSMRINILFKNNSDSNNLRHSHSTRFILFDLCY